MFLKPYILAISRYIDQDEQYTIWSLRDEPLNHQQLQMMTEIINTIDLVSCDFTTCHIENMAVKGVYMITYINKRIGNVNNYMLFQKVTAIFNIHYSSRKQINPKYTN